MDELNGSVINGRPIYCGRAQKKKERQMELLRKREVEKMERYSRYQGVNLYIKNLEDDLDDEHLRKEFAKFGNITSAKVHHPAGSARVCLESHALAIISHTIFNI